jgi:hypothetical protein
MSQPKAADRAAKLFSVEDLLKIEQLAGQKIWDSIQNANGDPTCRRDARYVGGKHTVVFTPTRHRV